MIHLKKLIRVHLMSKYKKFTAWFMWIQAVIFYFYQFIIRVATGNLQEPLTVEFNLSASQYGLFASYWLIAYALLQIPVGIALDRWGTRKIFSVSAFLCGLGTLIMAQTQSFDFLCLARFLIGAGSAAGFIGTFKISSEWFDAKRLPLLVGLISGSGVMGASLAGAPMVLLQSAIGWRAIFNGLSVIAFALSALYWIALRDKNLSSNLSLSDIKNQVLKLISEPQVWLLGIIGFLLYTPISVLAEVWGPSFMRGVYNYTAVEAAFTMSFIFYGNAVGSFLGGWVFLKFFTNRQFFAFFMTLAILIMTIIVWINLSNLWLMCFTLFALGCMVGAENMIFPLGARYVAEGYQGLSASVMNFLVMVGAIVLQPGVGIVMDSLWDGHIDGGSPVYSILQYRLGFTTLIGSLVVGLMLTLFIKGNTRKPSDT